jgi:hypothetical protein
VGTVQEIIHKRYKEGPKKNQTYYDLILKDTQEKLKAEPNLLKKEQFQQVENLALLDQNLVFQYQKWFNNKQILGWHSLKKSPQK